MANLYKDLAQNLRGKPSTAFSSSGSPLSVVQYVSDSIPISKAILPKVISVLRPGYSLGVLAHGLITTIKVGSGEVVAIGVIKGASFPGFGATVADYFVELDVTGLSDDPAAQGAALITTLRQLSILDGFMGDTTNVVVLDRDGAAVDWTIPAGVTKSADLAVTLSLPVLPKGYRRGDFWKKSAFLRIIDVWIEGSDDTHHNIVLLVKADLAKIALSADNVNFPDDLASDGSSVDYPYFGDSEAITWEFEVANPNSYIKADSCSAHPTNPKALLISEKRINDGGPCRIVRIYREVGPVSEQVKSGYQVSYEDPDGANLSERFPVVTLTLDVKLDGYTPPLCGAACPIIGATACGTNAELSFSSLVLMEPPVLIPQNTVYGQLSAVYGRIPGYITEDTSDSPRFGPVSTYLQRVAKSTTPIAKGSEVTAGSGKWVIASEASEQNSCSKMVKWQVATLPSCVKTGHQFNAESGELEPFKEFVIPTSQVPATIRALNEGTDLVTVVAGGGGTSAAAGDYFYDGTNYVKGSYYFQRVSGSWSLLGAGGETATGGDATGPGTATWANYTVTDVPGPAVGKLNTSGFYAVDQPIDCYFSLIRQQKASPFVSRTYDTYQNYSWPAVFNNFDMMTWTRQDGGSDIYPQVDWIRYAYSGPCRSQITETWSQSGMALDTVYRMIPLPIQYSCPAFSISVPPSLHPAGSFTCDFGTNHSVYAHNTGSTRAFDATTPLNWPPSLTVSSVQRPYKGGYLKRTIKVFIPDSPDATWPT